MRIQAEIHFTGSFEPTFEHDLRNVIQPKQSLSCDYPYKIKQPYYQVFEDRFEFTPNLSIIDLLFNRGPEANQYLTDCLNHFKNC